MSDSGQLIAVFGVATSNGRFEQVALQFASGTLMLSCDDDSDEVRASAENSLPREAGLRIEVLDDLAGMFVANAWELTNHSGYMDGFQLRLVDGRGREEVRQFEVAASAMDVRRVGD